MAKLPNVYFLRRKGIRINQWEVIRKSTIGGHSMVGIINWDGAEYIFRPTPSRTHRLSANNARDIGIFLNFEIKFKRMTEIRSLDAVK